MKIKNLIKTYGFWTALAGAAVVLVNSISRACGVYIEGKLVSDIIMAVAGVLVVFGVVSLPNEIYSQSEAEHNENQTQDDDKE